MVHPVARGASSAGPGGRIRRLRPDVAAAVLEEMAGLHVPVLGGPRSRRGSSGSTAATPESDGLLCMLVSSLLPGFLERYEDTLAPDHQEVCRLFAEHLPTYLRLRSGPRTACHGDFRLDNLLFQPGDCGGRRRLADGGLGRGVLRRGVLPRRLPQRRGPPGARGRPPGALPRRPVPAGCPRLQPGAAAGRRAEGHLRWRHDGHRRRHGRAADRARRPHVPDQHDPSRPARARCRCPPLLLAPR